MQNEAKSRRQLVDEIRQLRRQIVAQNEWLARNRQNDAHQHQLIDSLPVLVATAGWDGYYQQVNRAFERILGWSEKESLGRPFMEFIHPDDRLAAEQTFALLKAGTCVAEFVDRNLCRDGSYRWISWSVIPVLDSGFVFSIGQDITERKRAEAALQEARAELEVKVRERTAELAVFHRFSEAAGQGFAMADLQGRITYVNPAMCQLLGAECAEAVVGRASSDYYQEASRLRSANEVVPSVLRDGHWQGELTLGKGIDEKPTWQYVFLVSDEQGRPSHLAYAIIDLTQHKRAEEALQGERQSLWRMVQASDHERRAIAYGIHDGLAQHLAAAQMHLEVVACQYDLDPYRAKRELSDAIELIRHAHLESRRLISEVRPPVLDELGLETALEHLVYEHERCGGPQLEFHSSVTFRRLPVVLENALYRIAQEALGNACAHSQSDRVTLTLLQQPGVLLLEIRDWGIGFDPESDSCGHYGLEGIRQRTRLLGGRLAIDSACDRGTALLVAVPLLETQNDQ